MRLLAWLLVFSLLPAFDGIIQPTCSSTLQVRAILYIATLTTGIMEAVTNVDHAVAAALSTRHHPHSPANSTTRSARKLRVQAAILMPVREALKTLHESEDCQAEGHLLRHFGKEDDVVQGAAQQLLCTAACSMYDHSAATFKVIEFTSLHGC